MDKKWIWCKNACVTNSYVDFIDEIQLESVDTDAKIKISSDSQYALWINGIFVNCGQYNDFPDMRRYDTLNISKYLHRGKNRICISVYYYGKSTFQYSKGDAGLWFEISNSGDIFESNESVLSAPSPGFFQGEIFDTTMQLGFGFIYDASKDDDWKNPSSKIPDRFEKSSESIVPCLSERPIKKCVLKNTGKARLFTQGYFLREDNFESIAENMQSDYLSFRNADEIFESETDLTVKTEKNIYLVFDLERETSGYFTLSVEAEENTVVDFSYGEHLDDLRVRSSVGGRKFANRYICREGKQDFTYYFRRIAGRYIEIHITGKIKKINNVGITEAVYPVENYINFTSNDSLCNKIYEISAETLKQCMHEHYEDCPWREQALYASDSRNQMLCGYYAFKEFEFARASLDLLGRSAGEDLYVKMCAPTDCPLIIPSFSFIWFLQMKEYAEYSKDFSLIKHYADKIECMLDKYLCGMKDGIVPHPFGGNYWNFYEWSFECDGYEGRTPPEESAFENGRKDGLYQVFLYTAIKSSVQIFKMLGKSLDAEKYEKVLEIMKLAINRTFWDSNRNMYAAFVDCNEKKQYCELMQTMVLYNDIAGDKTEALCNLITSENDLVKITLSYTIYKYDALLAKGSTYSDYVYRDITEKWGNMLYSGATTFWETYDGADDFQNAGSLCHGWSAVPIYVFSKYGMGITPEIINESSNSYGNNIFEKNLIFKEIKK